MVYVNPKQTYSFLPAAFANRKRERPRYMPGDVFDSTILFTTTMPCVMVAYLMGAICGKCHTLLECHGTVIFDYID
jgi:hypothetical protein